MDIERLFSVIPKENEEFYKKIKGMEMLNRLMIVSALIVSDENLSLGKTLSQGSLRVFQNPYKNTLAGAFQVQKEVEDGKQLMNEHMNTFPSSILLSSESSFAINPEKSFSENIKGFGKFDPKFKSYTELACAIMDKPLDCFQDDEEKMWDIHPLVRYIEKRNF